MATLEQQMFPPVSGTSLPAGMRVLAETLRELNSQQEFAPLVSAVLQAACRLFGAQAATLLLVNKSTGRLEIAAVENIPEDSLRIYQEHPAGVECLRDNAPSAGRTDLENFAQAGYAQQTILPIRIQEKIIGCLTLAAERSVWLESELQICLAIFLEYIAQALENAYLIFHLRQQNARLEQMMTRLQNTQNHLRQAEKMAVVGKLAATVAHEIRNPLTIISTSLQMVFQQQAPAHPDHKLYEVMLAKIHAVEQTVKELMNFARPLPIKPQALGLRHTLEQVLTFIGKKYASRGLQLQLELPEPLPGVLADEEQLQRVFINLLLNAYHFLPDHGHVRVTAKTEPGRPWLEICVADNGAGIPEEHRLQLFEPFFTTRSDGTGLGLFLAKHLLEAMNGSIEVRMPETGGTEFILRLPVAPENSASQS